MVGHECARYVRRIPMAFSSRHAPLFRLAVLALGVVFAGSAGAAAGLTPGQFAPVRIPVAGCTPWTTSLPPLPAACKGVVPTVAQCGDPAWQQGPCGSDQPIIRKGYCQKALVEDFCKDSSTEELVFPVANSKASPIKPGANSLFIPPGQTLAGKQVGYTPLAARPGSKRAPSLGAGPIPISQNGGASPVRMMTNGMGTYATTTLPQWLGKYSASRQHVSDLHFGLMRRVPAAQLTRSHDLLLQGLAPEVWVGDGTDTPQNRQVNSCGEFVYQRWYDYTRFKNAAKGLGRDYRGIYALATDPSSPVYIEKAGLRQFAIGALPQTWPVQQPYHDPTTEIPRNVFFTKPSFAPSLAPAKQQAILARINKWSDSKLHAPYIILPNPAALPRFEVHRRMRALLEQKYHLSDDAVDERTARQSRYTELLTSRDDMMHDLLCSRAPHLCCTAPPTATQGTRGALLAKIRGAAVINPDPTQFGANGVDVGEVSTYSGFDSAAQLNVGAAAWSVKGVKSFDVAGVNSMKQKGSPFGKPPLLRPGTPATTATPTGATCEDVWTSKRPSLEAAMNALVLQLSDLVVKEYDLPNGCLEDAGNDLGNSCDWSYEKFAHLAMTYFDEDVEKDFKTCNERTHGSFLNVRDQNRQEPFIYPCEVRHDFGADQLDVQYFLDAANDHEVRKACDVQRAQQAVDAYLKQYADIVKRVPIKGDHIGESTGDIWSLGDAGSFGAHMTYNLGWEVGGGAGNPKTTDGSWCRLVGSGNMGASAGFYFFGSDVKVLEAESNSQTTETSVMYGAHLRLMDLDTLAMSDLFPPVHDQTVATSVPVVIPVGNPHVLGDIKYDFWMSIGPIPVHIFFGANASLGIDVKELGQVSSPTACTTANAGGKAIEDVALNFAAGTDFEPWVRADAYADASVDAVVASVGIHLDLLLLKIGLPTGATAAAVDGKALVIKTGSTLTVDALQGRVSAYAKFGISPLSYTLEVTLFGWDGLHTATQLFGRDDSFPLKLATWAAQSKVDPNSVKCLPYQSPNANGTPNATLAGHNWCLKNPTVADAKQVMSCAIPYAPPTGWGFCQDKYALRGPLQ